MKYIHLIHCAGYSSCINIPFKNEIEFKDLICIQHNVFPTFRVGRASCGNEMSEVYARYNGPLRKDQTREQSYGLLHSLAKYGRGL